MAEKTGRWRSTNFSEYEKCILIELVEQYRSIIDDKKTDGESNSRKENVWSQISEKFADRIGMKSRDIKQLKLCWKNLKARAKKDHHLFERLEAVGTGGGIYGNHFLSLPNAVHKVLPYEDQHYNNSCHEDGNHPVGDDKDSVLESELTAEERGEARVDTKPVIPLSQKLDTYNQQSLGVSGTEPEFLEMARAEHAAKMEIYKLKQDVLLLKKKKLEKEIQVLQRH